MGIRDTRVENYQSYVSNRSTCVVWRTCSAQQIVVVKALGFKPDWPLVPVRALLPQLAFVALFPPSCIPRIALCMVLCRSARLALSVTLDSLL